MTENTKKHSRFRKNLPIIIIIIVLALVTLTFFGDMIRAHILGEDSVETISIDGKPGDGKMTPPGVEKPNDPPKEPEKTPEELAADLAQVPHTSNSPTFYDTPYMPEGADVNLQLINKVCGVGKDYKPANLQLTKYRATDRAEANQYMVDYAADAMDAMIEGAMKEGYTILVTTAYRSYSMQSTLYNNYVAKDGQAAADRYSARPGTSEHQSGLAADLTSPSVGGRLTNDFADTDEGKWLKEHSWEYGFIKRFPEDGEAITGYMHEAWHYRYVGREAAEYIMKNGLTLEEYIAEKF